MWQGTVVSIQIAPGASAPMRVVAEVRAIPGRGLEGDRYFRGTGHYSARPGRGGREVTLVEVEAIEALERDLGITLVPADTRRNVATAGVPLNHLVDREFWVGPVRMRGTRLCEPCMHLEGLTRPGVMGGLVHRGGLRAAILTEGLIRAGEVVRPA
jgi:MOSC domain-containing protein YiiM